jgi:hypothetical protein
MTESQLLYGPFMITFVQIFSLIFLRIARRTAGQAATLVDEPPLMY